MAALRPFAGTGRARLRFRNRARNTPDRETGQAALHRSNDIAGVLESTSWRAPPPFVRAVGRTIVDVGQRDQFPRSQEMSLTEISADHSPGLGRRIESVSIASLTFCAAGMPHQACRIRSRCSVDTPA